MKTIATTKLWISRTKQPRRRITISVCAPEKDPLPGGNYRCLVKLPGKPSGRFIYGIDSLQSLMLAMTYIHIQINALQSKGAKLYMGPRDKLPLDTALIWMADTSKCEQRD